MKSLRAIPTMIVLIAVTALCMILVGYCSRGDEVRKAKAGETFADSRTSSAQDASTVRDGVEGKTQDIRDNVKAGTDAIRNAPDADRNFVAACRLCRIDDSSRSDCGLLLADTRCMAR